MSGPVLPIHEIDSQEFNSGFKKTHLDKTILEEEDLQAIEDVFGLSDRSPKSPVGHLSCDDYHPHGYRCNFYESPEAGVVDRLVSEIKRYQERIQQIKNSIN